MAPCCPMWRHGVDWGGNVQFHSKDPRTVLAAGGVADEESVDMEQRRDDQPQPESGPPGLIASGAQLAPPQEAYGKWTAHRLSCHVCRDIDAGPCEQAETLWSTYRALDAEALRQLHRGGS